MNYRDNKTTESICKPKQNEKSLLAQPNWSVWRCIRGKLGLVPLIIICLIILLRGLIYKWSQWKTCWTAAAFSLSFARGDEWTMSKMLFCSCNKMGLTVKQHDILSVHLHLFLLVGYSSQDITELTLQQFLNGQESV